MQLFTKLWATLKRKGNRMKFVNEAKPQEPNKLYKNPSMGFYKCSRPSKLLFQWSRYFQAIVSQAGTMLLTGAFHDSECAIYKCEGGCRIAVVGDLVLGNEYCYFDTGGSQGDKAQKLADLITELVLKFDPMDPMSSLINAGADHIGCDRTALRNRVDSSHAGGIFGGDALTDFFDWNPFSAAPIDKEYQRWVMVHFLKKRTDAEMDQMYADQVLGKELLEKLQEAFKERKAWMGVLCCSPSRDKKGELSFWINTGRSTQIDGHKTQEEIEKFLKSSEKIVDKMRG
jgi:hypothetical protein